MLYASPQAAISVNGLTSQVFSLERGKKQGCPLSPLLFAFIIEPLAETIRIRDQVKGFQTNATIHNISLYADDLLLFMNDPSKSIAALIKIIDEFSMFSGYKINYDNSLALPLGNSSSISFSEYFR